MYCNYLADVSKLSSYNDQHARLKMFYEKSLCKSSLHDVWCPGRVISFPSLAQILAMFTDSQACH